MDGSEDWRGGSARDAAATPVQEVAILALPAASASGVVSVHDDFSAIGRFPGCLPPACRFRPRIVTLSGRPERSLTGAILHPHSDLEGVARAGIVIVLPLLDDGSFARPAGEPAYPEALKAYLRDRHAAGATIVGMCTGAFPMAEAGLLEGREATAHWLYEPDLKRRHPGVRVLSRGTLVASGPGARLVTGGASVYPTEISLGIIAAFAGLAAAQQFAHLFGRFWRGDLEGMADRPGSPPPQIDDGAVAVACAWIDAHLATPALVRGAAAAAFLTERTLNRRFRRALGMTPADWVGRRRAEKAQVLPETTRLSVDEVALRGGYAEPAAFRRAFRRATGLTPSDHRRRFKLPPPAPGARR